MTRFLGLSRRSSLRNVVNEIFVRELLLRIAVRCSPCCCHLIYFLIASTDDSIVPLSLFSGLRALNVATLALFLGTFSVFSDLTLGDRH